MFGAIIGDIVGSRFEWHNIKTKDFELLNDKCFFTDDTVMSLAVAKAILRCNGNYENINYMLIKYMQELGRKYPDAGYGGHFRKWLMEENPQPYNSYGNGSAMRISAVAYVSNSIAEVKNLSRKVSEVSHNHPEGLKGAEATALAIYLARNGKSIDEIRDYIDKNYYSMNFKLADIRNDYEFDVSCQGSVPEALEAFFEAKDYEDAIRNAISIGGDSDTIAAITGGIAEAYYGIPEKIKEKALGYLTTDLKEILEEFKSKYR